MDLRASSRLPPAMPGGQIVVEAPPAPPTPTPVSPLARLMPVVMIVAMAGMSVLYLTSGSASARNPMFLFLPAMMLVSVIGTLTYGARGTGRTAEINVQRVEYLRYLDTLDDALVNSADAQHDALHWIHPDPAALWTLAGGQRMWERTAEHRHFCAVRVGLGEQPAATTVVAPALGSDDAADPVTTGAARRLVRRRSVVGGVPVVLSLQATATVTVVGECAAARAVARAVVCQVAMLHHPDLVGISALPGPDAEAVWEWVKWLPHHDDHSSAGHRVVIVDGSSRRHPPTG